MLCIIIISCTTICLYAASAAGADRRTGATDGQKWMDGRKYFAVEREMWDQNESFGG